MFGNNGVHLSSLASAWSSRRCTVFDEDSLTDSSGWTGVARPVIRPGLVGLHFEDLEVILRGIIAEMYY